MTTDLAFHYPPDVFDAVVDAVPLLTRGKRDVVLFFRGCGVDRAFLAGVERDKHELDHHNGRMKLDRTLFTTLTQVRRLEGRARPVCGPSPDPSQAKAVAPSMLDKLTIGFDNAKFTKQYSGYGHYRRPAPDHSSVRTPRAGPGSTPR